MGVGGCLFDILFGFLEDSKQIVRADKTSSWVVSQTIGDPQVTLLGTLLFCIVINDLLDTLRFSDPYLFADDLKI